MLRVLARSLILWEDVEPTSAWIEKQIPSVVLRAYLAMQASAEKTADMVHGMRDQNTDDSTPRPNQTTNILKGDEQDRTQSRVPNFTTQRSSVDCDVDRQTVRQMHAYIVTGSCFAMGLRFAGTADAQAASAITKVLLEMKSFRDSADPVPVALRPQQPIVGMCLGLCAVSLALVMAGTGDLNTLRLFKIIRWRSDEGIRHGAHMALSAAIGLLFLGGGMYTIGRSPEDVAAILTSFFPRFPMDSTDNKYHLQALRHMYVLAARQRHVEAFDIDSDERVSVLVQVSSGFSSPVQRGANSWRAKTNHIQTSRVGSFQQ
jgi:anaphase-promoting complex subunit 1